MGCSSQNKEIENIPLKEKLYETYSEVNPDIFNINFYKLNWKVKNVICYFQLIEKEILDKKIVSDFFILLSKTKIIEIKDIDFDLDSKNFLYYVFLTEGVFITRNYKKINYFMKNYISNLIKIDFVHISEEFLIQNEYFSLHEIKMQSKYFFELNKKEINFINRNKLIEEGKANILSENEIELNDESFSDEKNNEIEKDFEDEYSSIENEKDNENIENNIEKILNKNENTKKENYNKLNNIKNLSLEEKEDNRYKKIDLFLKNKNKNFKKYKYDDYSESNEINKKEKNDLSFDNSIINIEKAKNFRLELSIDNKKVNQMETKMEEENKIDDNIINEKINKDDNNNEVNNSYQNSLNNKINLKMNNILLKKTPFKIIKKDTLIIKANELNENTNKYLETFFYSFNNTINEFEHIDFYNEDLEEKENNSELNNINDEKRKKIDKIIPNDYILIYSNKTIPYEKRICLNDIKKIFFINCDFKTKSIFYLKQFIRMLMQYKNLKKFGIYYNKMNRNFLGWKFFKSLFQENFNIRWISFKNAYLDDKVFTLMAKGLILKRIRYLDISKNNLSNSCMYFLNELLLKNQTLIHLDISYNKHISFKGIQFILNGIKFHSNLTNLILNHLNLNNCGLLIVELLKENKNIKKLCIRHGKFDIKDIKEIVNEIGKAECSLTYLDISSNKTPDDSGLKEIGKLILYNQSLKHLSLDNLNLNLNNYLPIFQNIFKNRTIESYSLDMNKGLPVKGILNFFLKNPQVKKISFTPWNIKKEPKKKFSREHINLIQAFHAKAPEVKIVNFDLRQRKSTKYYSHK